MSDSLWPGGLQHARLACPLLSPGACSNSCPLSWWCHPTTSSSVTPFFCLQSFLTSVFSNALAFHIRWPKCWSSSFSINPSDEYSVLNSFRMEWSDLLAVSKIHHWEWSKKGVRGKCPLSGISGTPHFWSGWPDLLTVPPFDGVGSELREVHLLLSASGSDARLI